MRAPLEIGRVTTAALFVMLALGAGLWMFGCGAPQDSAAYRAGSDAPAEQPVVNAWTLTDAQREAMLNVLIDGEPHPVWFSTDVRNKTAKDFQLELEDVFAQAGWEVKGNSPTPFPMKPGLYFFSADVDSPDYVVTAQAAFDAAGITVIGGTDYRAYYRDQKKADPNWKGFDMAEDQTFLIVVGREPESESI